MTIRRLWQRATLMVTLAIVLLTGMAGLPQRAVADELVLIGAGDIANCSSNADELTADLINNIGGLVYTVGDNVYPNGSEKNWTDCWGPSWGTIDMGRLRPVPGNHDYERAGSPPYYFTHFKPLFDNILPPDSKGWYLFDAAGWRVLMLNSQEPDHNGTPQNQFVRWALDSFPGQCVLAMWHHPRFSSGAYGVTARMKTSFRLLYERGGSVLVSGDAHHYERMAPMDPSGRIQPGRGVRQFIVGTGGAYLTKLGQKRRSTEARSNASHGVLKLTLRSGSYDWEFIPVNGERFTDSGSAPCSTR